MPLAPSAGVTVSVGISTARAVDIAGSQQNIIIAADQALYQAKRAGRNGTRLLGYEQKKKPTQEWAKNTGSNVSNVVLNT